MKSPRAVPSMVVDTRVALPTWPPSILPCAARVRSVDSPSVLAGNEANPGNPLRHAPPPSDANAAELSQALSMIAESSIDSQRAAIGYRNRLDRVADCA